MRRVLVLLFVAVAGIASAQDLQPSELIDRAQRFRALMAQEEWEEARSMMAADPRRWFEAKSGEGRDWVIGPNSGPWARWDEEFDSSSTVVEWVAGPSSVTARVLEINDYYRLLDRGAMTNEVTYYFDENGLIEGLLIRATGERPAGRTREFLRWALENEPRELKELMPDGDIDPSGDHPQRFRALLESWRVAAGLPLREDEDDTPTESETVPRLESPVARVAERFAAALLENDEDAVLAVLSAEAVLIPADGRDPVTTEAAIRSFLFPAGEARPVVVYEQTYDEIEQSGEIGWARGRFVMEHATEGSTDRREGNYMMLLRRIPSGEWKITHLIWSD